MFITFNDSKLPARQVANKSKCARNFRHSANQNSLEKKKARGETATRFQSWIDLDDRLPRSVVTVNPDPPMVTPDPVTRDPIPTRAVIIVRSAVVVISSIAEIDVDSDRARSRRDQCSRAKKRGQQNRKFVFHNDASWFRFRLTGVDTIRGQRARQGVTC